LCLEDIGPCAFLPRIERPTALCAGVTNFSGGDEKNWVIQE
jgi:hypothetical protein